MKATILQMLVMLLLGVSGYEGGCQSNYDCPIVRCAPDAPCPLFVCETHKCVAKYNDDLDSSEESEDDVESGESEPVITESTCTKDFECPQPHCEPVVGRPCPFYVCESGECVAKYNNNAEPEPEPVACGSNVCKAGDVCCNPTCGICTAPGGFCTQQSCGGSNLRGGESGEP